MNLALVAAEQRLERNGAVWSSIQRNTHTHVMETAQIQTQVGEHFFLLSVETKQHLVSSSFTYFAFILPKLSLLLLVPQSSCQVIRHR